MRIAALSLLGLALAGFGPRAAHAQTQASPDEVARLREELQQLRQAMVVLESRLDALQAAPPSAPPTTAAAPAPDLAPAPDVAPALPAPAASDITTPSPQAAAGSKVFNPDIAAVGNFLGAAGKSPGGGEPSLEMHEAEVSFQAVVDPYARADFFLAFGPEGVDVEEAFITFPTVPGGLLLKVGKMRTAFGKVDGMHNHVLPWTDRPLVTKNLVGGEEGLSDSGISISRLFPNSFVFLEATGQVYRGASEVFQAPNRADLTYVGHLRAYRDLTENTNLDLGGSIAYGHNDSGPDQTTTLFGVDAAFRFRPLRRAIYQRLILRSELVWSRRGQPTGPTSPPDPANAPGVTSTFGTANAFGAYGTIEYQFARRWYAGGRFDWSERADDASLRDKGGSLLLTWWPSEFSQIRGQYRYTRFAEGRTANEFLFQFLFSIGAHGAHTF
ncbi:MAG: hypothetical protein ACHQKZ_04760 [Solirubrobacterales bacterium]|jgi:hypothetical protein